MKRNLRWMLGLVVVLLVVVVVLTVNRGGTAGHEFRVGVILPETGTLAEMGQVERRAMELAERTLKSKGERLVLIFEDGKGDNKVVAAAATKLLEIDRVSLLITSTTGASQTAQPIAEHNHVPQLVFAMASDIAPKSPTAVRFYIGIEEESRALVEAMKRLPRNTKLAVLHANVSVWPTVMESIYRPFFREHFDQEPIVEQYDFKSKDFRPPLTKVKVGGATTLVLLGYGFEYPEIFRQMRELGMRDHLQILGGWGFLYTGLPAEELDGIRVAGSEYVFARPTTGQEFERLYRDAYGGAPNFDAAFAFEAIAFVPTIRAMLAKSSAQDLKRLLAEGGTYRGTFGEFSFTPEGNMVVKTGVGVYHGGVLVGE